MKHSVLIATVILFCATSAPAQLRPRPLDPPTKGGDTVRAAVLDWEHPFGDTARVPCVHLTTQHPDGDPGPSVPCTHLGPQHPDGDEQRVPCTHGPRNFHREGDIGRRTVVGGPCLYILHFLTTDSVPGRLGP